MQLSGFKISRLEARNDHDEDEWCYGLPYCRMGVIAIEQQSEQRGDFSIAMHSLKQIWYEVKR